jgi:hypothetical protein
LEIYEEKDKLFLVFSEMGGGTLLDIINNLIETD